MLLQCHHHENFQKNKIFQKHFNRILPLLQKMQLIYFLQIFNHETKDEPIDTPKIFHRVGKNQ